MDQGLFRRGYIADNIVVTDVGTGCRLLLPVLPVRPDAVAVPGNLPDPCGKMLGNQAFVQRREDVQRNVGGQVLGLVAAARPFQAEIEELLHIVRCKFGNQPLCHLVCFFHRFRLLPPI